MLSVVRSWWAARGLVKKVEMLETRVLNLLADVFESPDATAHVKQTRILLAGEERQWICGTEAQIEQAATRMARRTKQCVTVAVAIAHYHRRGCKDLPAGGLDVVGN